MYYLVEFSEEKSVAVIPGCWREGNQCAAWPVGYSANKRARAVINQEEPPQDHPDWKSFLITDLYWDYDYDKVRRKEKASTFTSDLNSTTVESDSEDDGPRKSKRHKSACRMMSSGDETDHEAEVVLIPQKKSKAAKSHSVPSGLSLPPASALIPPPLSIAGTSYGSQYGSTSPQMFLPTVSSRSYDHRRSNPGLSPFQAERRADHESLYHTSSQSYECGTLERGYRVSSNGVVMNEEVITRLFTNQETLIEMVKQLKEEVQTLKRIQTSGAAPLKSRDQRMPDNCRFPLETMDQADSMENLLTTPNGVIVVMNALSVCGGTTVHDVVWGIMHKVFHHALAPLFCWSGTKEKKSFKDMKFLSVLCDTVRENQPTERCKDIDIKHEIKEFFRGAHDRLKARERKVNQQQAEFAGANINVN